MRRDEHCKAFAIALFRADEQIATEFGNVIFLADMDSLLFTVDSLLFAIDSLLLAIDSRLLRAVDLRLRDFLFSGDRLLSMIDRFLLVALGDSSGLDASLLGDEDRGYFSTPFAVDVGKYIPYVLDFLSKSFCCLDEV